MTDEINRLITGSFERVQDRAKQALTYGTDAKSDDALAVLSSANRLLRRTEHALRNLRPPCERRLAQFGSNFIEAVCKNGNNTAL